VALERSLQTRAPHLVRKFSRRPLTPTSLRSVLGTAAAHNRACESSILSTATNSSYIARAGHGFDSKSNAAGFKSSAVCVARFVASNSSPAFVRAAVWQQSRWVMPSPKARLLFGARYQRANNWV
jgi:hypothetical protein